MIKDFNPRLYQQTIFGSCTKYNTLVVLPTGLGKTNVFLMAAAHRLKLYPQSKILLLGPTRPLIEQYRDVFLKHFDIDKEKIVILTGQISPKKREKLWAESQIILSTPQGLENDIISNRISLKDVSLLGFDEAHKATGDYSYVWIAKMYHERASHPRIIAMTASPGANMEKITEVMKNLCIESIEVRTEGDPDVKPYMKEIKLHWAKVDLPEEFRSIQKYFQACIKTKIDDIKALEHDLEIYNQMSKKDILSLQAQIHAEISTGNKDFNLLKTISLLAEIMKVQHAMELLETQGIEPLFIYIDGILKQSYSSKVKAVQNLAKDANFRAAYVKTETLYNKNTLHPKLIELKNIISDRFKKNPDLKIIVFNHFRNNAKLVTDELNKIPEVDCKLFVGQAKKSGTGLSQKEQKAILDDFREHKFNVICMTSVGEEGLDIPKVDLVLFYEPIPSSIRHIQRRGRTGRLEKGEVIILMTKGTRDEAYRWSAHHKEKKMFASLRQLKSKMKGIVEKKPQVTLNDFAKKEKDVTVYADHREKASGVIKDLIDKGTDLRLERLESADYVLSARVGVEFKNKLDFVNSIVDGRLLSQLKDLKNNFERPIIIVEGPEDIYSIRNIHPAAIQGMLSTIAVSYGIPIIYTKSQAETASILYTIAKREQTEEKHEFTLHGAKRTFNLKEQQEYIASALPSVGPTLAKDLLKNFGTLEKLFAADVDDLKKVPKVGKKIAEKIRSILEKEYN